jgi:hypothetical protein
VIYPGHDSLKRQAKEVHSDAPGASLGAVEAISMEAYPVLYCGYDSAERPTPPPSRPAERFELEGPRSIPRFVRWRPPSSSTQQRPNRTSPSWGNTLSGPAAGSEPSDASSASPGQRRKNDRERGSARLGRVANAWTQPEGVGAPRHDPYPCRGKQFAEALAALLVA